jgi:hypothetical protein
MSRSELWEDVGYPLCLLALVLTVAAGLAWYLREWQYDRDTAREDLVYSCFGEERLFQCKISARPGECIAYLERQARVECSEDLENVRQ